MRPSADMYALPESIDRRHVITARYLASGDMHDYLEFAGRLAVEGSTGSWIPLPLETPELLRLHGAKVIGVFEVPDYEHQRSGKKANIIVDVAYPDVNLGTQIPMLLNTVIGVVSNFGDLKLVELELPERFVAEFPGPRQGIQGMRRFLGVPIRPLCCNVMKPCVGMDPRQTAQLFYEVALGGIDIVKDDEKLANVSYSTVAARVAACMAAERRAYEETGEHTYYAVNITDDPLRAMDNAKAALEVGGNMLMLSHLTAGFGVLRSLAEAPEIRVPIMVHPDFAGGFSRSERLGMSSHLSLGKLARISGADISDLPTSHGTVPITQEKCTKICMTLRSPLYGIRSAWPMLGGGLHPGMIKAVVDDLGFDVIVGGGGAVHAHPLGPKAGAKAFRQAIDAAVHHRSLRDAGREHPELGAATAIWGITRENALEG